MGLQEAGRPHALDDYVDPQRIYEEIDFAEKLFKRSGFTILDVTDRPIESNADDILRLLSRRFPENT